MPGHKPTLINGRIYKYREKKEGRRESFVQRKKNIHKKMNTDEILMYSMGPKGMLGNSQPDFKELKDLNFDTDLKHLFSDVPLNSAGFTTHFDRRASSVNRTGTLSSL